MFWEVLQSGRFSECVGHGVDPSAARRVLVHLLVALRGSL